MSMRICAMALSWAPQPIGFGTGVDRTPFFSATGGIMMLCMGVNPPMRARYVHAGFKGNGK